MRPGNCYDDCVIFINIIVITIIATCTYTYIIIPVIVVAYFRRIIVILIA